MEEPTVAGPVRHLVPPLELTSELNPRNFALMLLQRLGNTGVSNLESAVRGCGVKGISGDAFVQSCLRCLAHSVLLPDACSYPWQRRCVTAGPAATAKERSYESDPLVATMGFLPTSITTHAGMNFVDAGDRYSFFSAGGSRIQERSKFLSKVVEAHKSKHTALQSSVECFDQAGDSLRYALTLLYHAMDVHNSNAMSWEEVSTFFSDVTTRGAARLGSAAIGMYTTFVNREVQFPRQLRIVDAQLNSTSQQQSAAPTDAAGSLQVSSGPSISASSPPAITQAAYNSTCHRFAVATSGGAVVLLDGSSFTLRETIRDNAAGATTGAVVAMDYFHRVQRAHGGKLEGGAKGARLGVKPSDESDGGGGGIVAVATADCVVRLYDDRTQAMLNCTPFGSTQTALKYMPSLRSVVCGARSGLVSLLVSRNHARWQSETFTCTIQDRVNDFAFQQRAVQLLVATAGGQLAGFDVDSGALVADYHTPVPCDIVSMDYSSHFDVVAFSGPGHSPCLLVPGSGYTPIAIQESESAHRHPLCRVQFVPNSPQLLSFDLSGLVKVWDLRNRQCVQTIQTCRRVPVHLYAFPNDDVVRKSRALRGLVTMHETSTEYRLPCHELRFATLCGGAKIACLDGAGVEVLQPLLVTADPLEVPDDADHAAASTPADTQSVPFSGHHDDDARRAQERADKMKAAAASHEKRQRAAEGPLKGLEVVTLPHWFALPGNEIASAEAPPLAHDVSSCVTMQKHASKRVLLHERIQKPTEADSADGELRREVLMLSKTREELIVGYNEHSLYLWRVGTGEVVVHIPLREDYNAWRQHNVAAMSAARDTKRRELDLQKLQQGVPRHSSSSQLPTAAEEELELQSTNAALDRAARQAAHPRFFAVGPRQQLSTAVHSDSLIKIKSCCFVFNAEVPLVPAAYGAAAPHSAELRGAGFDVGLDDGTMLHLPIKVSLVPASQRPPLDKSAIEEGGIASTSGIEALRLLPYMQASYNFDVDAPFAVFRLGDFLTSTMIEDARAGAHALPPEVACVRGLQLTVTPAHPQWSRHGESILGSAELAEPNERASSPSKAVPSRGAQSAIHAALFMKQIGTEPRKSEPWLLEGVAKKVPCVVRCAAGPTAILYLGALTPPTESTYGLAEHKPCVAASVQLTANEVGRPFTVAVWCVQHSSAVSAPSRPTSPTARGDRVGETASDDALSTSTRSNGSSTLSPVASSAPRVFGERNVAAATTVTEGEDIVVYAGMANNVSLFYTVRLAKLDTTTGNAAQGSSSRRARSLSLSQSLVLANQSTSGGSSSRLMFNVLRVVRLRTMPDNAVVLRSNPITSTSLIAAADSVGGVQLLYAPLLPAHYPVCLSRFTAFQPSDEAYTPLVVSVQHCEHGILFVAAGSHVSVFSVQKVWKNCFPEDWSARWAEPQEIAVEANASLIQLPAGNTSSTDAVAAQLEEQIRQQPPTPSLVRYFDVAEACRSIVSMVYVAAKKCLLIGGSDGRLHVYSLWGVRMSVNWLPVFHRWVGEEERRRVETAAAEQRRYEKDAASVLERIERSAARAAAPPPAPTARKALPLALVRKHHGARHLSALVAENGTGLSITYNPQGGCMGPLQALEDDVPFPWGRGKPLSIFRANDRRPSRNASFVDDEEDVPCSDGGASPSSPAAIERAASGRTKKLSDVDGVPADRLPLDSSAPHSDSASLPAVDSGTDTSSSASSTSPRHGKFSEASNSPSPQGSFASSGFRRKQKTKRPLKDIRPVHTVKHTERIAPLPAPTSAVIVQPSETQLRQLGGDADTAASLGGKGQRTADASSSSSYVSATVEALLNQDILEKYAHLEGEAKESNIMMDLMERVASYKQAKLDAVRTRRELVGSHAAKVDTLRDECRHAFLEHMTELEMELANESGAEGAAAVEEPSIRAHLNLNPVLSAHSTFNEDGSAHRSADTASKLRRATAALMPMRDAVEAILESSIQTDTRAASAARRRSVGAAAATKAKQAVADDEERDLLSFASAAGGLFKRFRQSRSASLHAALARVVGTEREMAGDLSVESELDLRIAKDLAHDAQLRQVRRASSALKSASAAMDPVAPSAGVSAEVLQSFTFGDDSTVSFNGGGIDAAVVSPTDAPSDDDVPVEAVSNRRRSSCASSASRRDSEASLSSGAAAARRASADIFVSSPSRRSSAASEPKIAVQISKADAQTTRRKSVSLLGAVGADSSGGGGAAGSDDITVRWTSVIADRKGMRRRQRAVSVVESVEGDTRMSTPSPLRESASPITGQDGCRNSTPIASFRLAVDEPPDPHLVVFSPSPAPAADEVEESRRPLGGVSPSVRVLKSPLSSPPPSAPLSLVCDPSSLLFRTRAPTSSMDQLLSEFSSSRAQTSALLELRALEGVADASAPPRHIGPSIAGRLFHRAKAPPLVSQDGDPVARHSWSVMDDEGAEVNRMITRLVAEASHKLYGGASVKAPRPISALSSNSSSAGQRESKMASPALRRSASATSDTHGGKKHPGLGIIETRLALQQQRIAQARAAKR